jgi:hypothetical protein
MKFKMGGSGIHIKPENKGKFTATKKATGKSTEELTHSKNPVTKKRAIFAQNAAKWKHEDGAKSMKVDEKMCGSKGMKYAEGTKSIKFKKKEMMKRADGSYSQRGLWDNVRANKGSGKKPTPEMLKQERKIKAGK